MRYTNVLPPYLLTYWGSILDNYHYLPVQAGI